METKCQQCFYGANLEGFRGSIYRFKQIIKRNRHINYKEGELGCRSDEYNEKENICLNNNFSEFKKFEE